MKKAFSIIEVVLAIIIIGVSMLAIPTIISQSTVSNLHAIRQEATLSAKMQMSLMFAMPWDSKSIDSTASHKVTLTDSKTLGLQNPIDTNGNEITDSNARKNLKNNIYTKEKASKPSKKTSLDGLDHLDGFSKELKINPNNTQKGDRDLIVPIKTEFSVSYIDDSLKKGNYLEDRNTEFNFTTTKKTDTTNIKMIELKTCFTEDGKSKKCSDKNKDIILRAYSANVAPAFIITKEIR